MKASAEVVTSLTRAVTEVLLERAVPSALPAHLWPGRDEATASAGPVARLCGMIDRELRRGRGFCVLSVDREEANDLHLIKTAYWNLLTSLGQVIPQYATGELMYDVEPAAAAPLMSHYSRTSVGGGFHTDGTFLPRSPFYAGLICLRQAGRGGESVLIDGREIYHELARHYPDRLARLRREFCFETCGQIPDVEFRRQPIISGEASSLRIQYLRSYIIEGQRRAGIPLDVMALSSLDTLDELMGRECFQFVYKLRPGEMLLLNNHRMLHGRKAFAAEPDQPGRLLVRVYALDPKEAHGRKASPQASGREPLQ